MSAPSIWTVTADGGDWSGIDRAEAIRAVSLLFSPGEHHELRSLPSARSRSVCLKSMEPDEIADIIETLSDDRGVYWTLNPVQANLGNHAAKIGDILRRRWLLIDIDPKKENPDASSTEKEKDAAHQLALTVLTLLLRVGWPDPVIIDSGNGFHLLFRIDLPNDSASSALIRDVLKVLSIHNDNEFATVDKKVHNLSRISKLPGTWVRKGMDTPERPHRMSSVLSAPNDPQIVTVELLREIAGPAHEDPPKTILSLHPWSMETMNGDGHSAYVRSAMLQEIARVAISQEGERNDILNTASFSLGTLLGSGLIDRGDLETQLELAATRTGLSIEESRKTIRSGLDAGLLKPRVLPDPKRNGSASRNGTGAGKKVFDFGGSPLVTWASAIKPKKVEFLWPGRIPRGKMTTFAGQGGLGKTFVLLDIAARISVGEEWPFSKGAYADVGNVLFISGEDDEDDTLVPRLIEMGADLNKIGFLSPPVHDNFNLAALELLTGVVNEMTDVRLVVVDPPASYLDGADDHKNAELRAILSPLKRWASETNASIVFNTHINKATSQSVDAAARVMGSVAWVNAVRAAHMFVRDEEDDELVVFVPIKMNNTKRPIGLSYKIVETKELAKIEWIGEVNKTADDAMNKEGKKSKGKNAREWLIDMFSRRREWPSDLFWKELKAGSVSDRSLNQIRESLDIPKAHRVSQPNGDVQWVWWVPEDWPHFMPPEK